MNRQKAKTLVKACGSLYLYLHHHRSNIYINAVTKEWVIGRRGIAIFYKRDLLLMLSFIEWKRVFWNVQKTSRGQKVQRSEFWSRMKSMRRMKSRPRGYRIVHSDIWLNVRTALTVRNPSFRRTHQCRRGPNPIWSIQLLKIRKQ